MRLPATSSARRRRDEHGPEGCLLGGGGFRRRCPPHGATISEKRRRTALHEAGHAVVARAAGFTVNEVSLHEEGGGVCWVEARTRTSPEDIKRELSWVLAGRLAVALDANEYLTSLSLHEIVEREANADWPGSSSRGLRGYRRSLEELLPAHRAPDGWLDDWLPVVRDETARVLLRAGARWSSWPLGS